jgi:hypothetical protein
MEWSIRMIGRLIDSVYLHVCVLACLLASFFVYRSIDRWMNGPESPLSSHASNILPPPPRPKHIPPPPPHTHTGGRHFLQAFPMSFPALFGTSQCLLLHGPTPG